MLPSDGNNLAFDCNIVYFFAKKGNTGCSSAQQQCKEDSLRNLSLLEFQQKLEQLLVENVCRLYFIDGSEKEINIINNSKLKEMWKYFDSLIEPKKIFFDYERKYIANYLLRIGYEDVVSFQRRGRSYLFTAKSMEERVIITITVGISKEEVEREVLSEKYLNIISRERIIYFDSFKQKFFMGYEMVLYHDGDLTNIAKPLSEISFLVLAMKMSAIIQFLQQMEHVHYNLKLTNFLIGSKVTRGHDVIYDPILIDLEYTKPLASLMKEKDERLSKSKIQYSEFCKDLIAFGDFLLALFKFGENWGNHKAIEELISKIRNSNPVKNQPIKEKPNTLTSEIPNETFLSIKKILKAFTTLAFKVRPEVAVDYIDYTLIMNKKFMLKLINISPIALNETLKKDTEFVKMVLNIDPHLLKYVPDELRCDYIFMQEYIRKDGLLLQYSSDSLRRNADFVKIAINETACAIMFVTEIFDGYTDLLKDCLNRNAFLLEFALVKTKDIVKCAISKDPLSICFASEQEFVNDSDIQQIIEHHKTKEANLNQKTQTRFINWEDLNMNHPSISWPKNNNKETKYPQKHVRLNKEKYPQKHTRLRTSIPPTVVLEFKKGISYLTRKDYAKANDCFINVKNDVTFSFLSGLELLIAHCYLIQGESLLYFNSILTVLKIEQNCKAAHIYNILYFISCRQLDQAQEAYSLLNLIGIPTDPNFGILGEYCDDFIKNIFVKKETIISYPYKQIRSYVIVHYQNKSKKITFHNLTIDRLKEICKKEFVNDKLEILKLIEEKKHTPITNNNELQPQREYIISEILEDIMYEIPYKFIIGHVPIIGSVYENLLDSNTVVKLIKEEESYSFELTSKLINYRFENVVKVIATHRDNSYMYIIMEKCEKSLETYLKETDITLTNIIRIILEISRGTKQLHSTNIVHLDVKVENGMSIDNRVVLIDFGEAMDVEEEFKWDTDFEFDTGTTKLIAAPEFYYITHKILKTDVFAADCWSVGMTFLYLIVVFLLKSNYSMLKLQTETGHEYFGTFVAKTGSQVKVHERVKVIISSICCLESKHQSELIDIICSLLEKDLSKRMSINNLIQRLESLIEVFAQKSDLISNNDD